MMQDCTRFTISDPDNMIHGVHLLLQKAVGDIRHANGIQPGKAELAALYEQLQRVRAAGTKASRALFSNILVDQQHGPQS